MYHLPNIISISRMVTALLLLLCKREGMAFLYLYLYCGLSDVLDGMLARRLRCCTKTGQTLDSIADVIFLAVGAYVILPSCRLSVYIWIWVALIFVSKIGVAIRFGSLWNTHHALNRLTGIALYFFVLLLPFMEDNTAALPACILASLSVIWEAIWMKSKEFDEGDDTV